eukprot:scaffold626_cov337-Pavlova_lutheri.AAC.51
MFNGGRGSMKVRPSPVHEVVMRQPPFTLMKVTTSTIKGVRNRTRPATSSWTCGGSVPTTNVP